MIVKFGRGVDAAGTPVRAWQLYVRVLLRDDQVCWRWKNLLSFEIPFIGYFELTLAAPFLVPNS